MPDNYEVYYLGTADSPMFLQQWLQGLLDDNLELVCFSEGWWVFRKVYPLEDELRAEIARRDEELKITDGLLKEATETIGAVIACCTYNSNDDAKIGIYGIDQKAFTMIDQFITHYNDAVSAGKVSVDVKRELSDAEITRLENRFADTEACNGRLVEQVEQLTAERDAVTAWNCRESVENIDKALQLLSKLYEKHYECEDCWYSCPKSDEGCCNEYAEDRCTCGADKHNALIDEIVNILKTTERTRE